LRRVNSRGLARLRRLDDFADDGARFLRTLLEPLAEHFVDNAFDDRAHFRGHQLVLGLR
jgi:hypothetical protein